jgi:hypothetical protein
MSFVITQPREQRALSPLVPIPLPLARDWGVGRRLGGAATRGLAPEQEAQIRQQLDLMRNRMIQAGLNELLQRLWTVTGIDQEALRAWIRDFDGSDDEGIALSIAVLNVSIIGPGFDGDDAETLIPLDDLSRELLIELGEDPETILEEARNALLVKSRIEIRAAVDERVTAVFQKAMRAVIEQADGAIDDRFARLKAQLLVTIDTLHEGEDLIADAAELIKALTAEVLAADSPIAAAEARCKAQRRELTAMLDKAQQVVTKDMK